LNPLRRARGFSVVTALILIVAAGVAWWGISYGPAYLDDMDVKTLLREAAAKAYHDPSDERIRLFILDKMRNMPKLIVTPDDVRIERTETPKYIRIWVSYTRAVKPLFSSSERTLSFSKQAEQDLSPVKW